MFRLSGLLVLFFWFGSTAIRSDPPHKCDSCDEWNKPREPFKIFGNSYFVGTDGLSAILIAGDAGPRPARRRLSSSRRR